MAREVHHKRRALITLLLLFLMFYAQSAGLAASLEPHHATDHCCWLCHIGVLPFLDMAAPAQVAPIVVLERLMANPDFHASRDILLNNASSRAPPG